MRHLVKLGCSSRYKRMNVIGKASFNVEKVAPGGAVVRMTQYRGTLQSSTEDTFEHKA